MVESYDLVNCEMISVDHCLLWNNKERECYKMLILYS